MKKSFVFLITLSMLFASLPFSAIADEEQYIFELSEDGTYYILVSTMRNLREIVVPEEYNGLPVRAVGDYTWDSEHDNEWYDPFRKTRTTLERIFLNENIYSMRTLNTVGKEKPLIYKNGKYIGTKDNPYYALVGMVDSKVTEFEIHEDTEIIAEDAITAIYLENITLSDSLKYIHYDGFCPHTQWVGFKYECLNYHTYGNCLYLGTMTNPYHLLVSLASPDVEEIEIHKNTKVIAPEAFHYMEDAVVGKAPEKLQSICIPKSVISIGVRAFIGCTGLKEINFEAESIEDLEICEIGSYMPENVTVNWGYGKEAEEAPEGSAPSTSDEGDGNGNTIIWVICGVAALAVVVGVLTAVLARKRKTV